MTLAAMCLQGSAMIAVVLVVRLLLGKHLPKAAFMLLWGLVLLRLLVPFSIPFAGSAWILADHATSVITGSVMQVELAGSAESQALAGSTVEAETSLEAGGISQFVDSASTLNSSIALKDATSTTPFSLWQLIWALGSGAVAILLFASYARGMRRFVTATPVDNPSAHQWLSAHRLRRPLRIVQVEFLVSPVTYGVLWPVIVVPCEFDWSDPSKSALVLEHEYVHVVRFDALFKLLLAVALCLYWFDPLVWAMWAYANRDIELSCDERVARRLNGRGRMLYVEALIDTAELHLVSGVPFAGAGFGRNAVEERVTALGNVRPSSLAGAVAIALIAFGTVAALATTPSAGKESDEPMEEAASNPLVVVGEPALTQNDRVDASVSEDMTRFTTARYSATLHHDLLSEGFTWEFFESSTQSCFADMCDILAVTDLASDEVVLYVYCYPRNPLQPEYSVPGDPGEIDGYQIVDEGRSEGDSVWGIAVAVLESWDTPYNWAEWGGKSMVPVNGYGGLTSVRGLSDVNLPDDCYNAYAVEEEGGMRIVTPWYSVLIPEAWLNEDLGVGYSEGTVGIDGTGNCRSLRVTLSDDRYFMVYCSVDPIGNAAGWVDYWTGLTTSDGLNIYVYEAVPTLSSANDTDYVSWVSTSE